MHRGGLANTDAIAESSDEILLQVLGNNVTKLREVRRAMEQHQRDATGTTPGLAILPPYEP